MRKRRLTRKAVRIREKRPFSHSHADRLQRMDSAMPKILRTLYHAFFRLSSSFENNSLNVKNMC